MPSRLLPRLGPARCLSSSSPHLSSDLLVVVFSTRSSSPPSSSAISPSSRLLPLPPLQRLRIQLRLCLLRRQAQPVNLATPELSSSACE
ncbi:hypothetical protein Bca52824_052699 [Brassica carinata]|uniref:Uncharacterized protein n=1 Tax=Brassica carinata TaxID=52824 RepID=A0A8X7R2T7_BRACI|nr:hypothetical protein Bca52824_052699 [Brassica carinata]